MKKIVSSIGTEYVYKGHSIWLNASGGGLSFLSGRKYSIYIKGSSEIVDARADSLAEAKGYINLYLADIATV